MKPRCDGCRFYDAIDGPDEGLCRRLTPSMLMLGDTDPAPLRAVWPEVDASDWCGEFRPADTVSIEVSAEPPRRLGYRVRDMQGQEHVLYADDQGIVTMPFTCVLLGFSP